MVTKTVEELDQMRLEVQQGKLPPDAIKQHFAAEERTVFGQDLEKKKGQPVEKGFGSPGRETNNHFNGIRKYEGEDAYQAALEEIHKRDPDHAKRLGLPKPRKVA